MGTIDFSKISGYAQRLPPYIPSKASIEALDATDVNIAADNAIIPVVYGRQRVQAKIATVNKTISGDLVISCIWCLGEVEEVENILIEGKFHDSYNAGDITVVTYTGTTVQTADPTLQGLITDYSDTLISTDFGYNIGVCYSVITILKSAGLNLPSFEAIIKGRKVYDPRDGGQVEGTDSTWLYSNNPSLCLADFLKSKEYGWDRTVDYSTVTACADYNDEIIPTTTIKRHEVNITMGNVSKTEILVEGLRAYAHCFIRYDGNTISMVPDDIISYSPPEVSEGSILSLALKKNPITDLPTAYRIAYTDIAIEDVDPEGEWGKSEAIAYASGVITGTTQRRESLISMFGYTNYNQAYREAIQRLNYFNISQLYASWSSTDEALEYQVGDVVNVTHRLGLVSQSFRIFEVKPNGIGRWTIIAQEYDAAIYSDFNTTGPAGVDPNLPNPLDIVPPVTDLTAVEDVNRNNNGVWSSRLFVTWTASDSSYVIKYRVVVYDTTDLVNAVFRGDVTDTEAYTTELPMSNTAIYDQTISYKVQVYAITKLTASVAAEITIDTTGNTLAPALPLNFKGDEFGDTIRLTWEHPDSFLDIKYYEIRIGNPDDSWAQASVYESLYSKRLNVDNLPTGSYVIYIKSVDHTGRYSTLAAKVNVDVTSDVESFILDEYFFQTLTSKAASSPSLLGTAILGTDILGNTGEAGAMSSHLETAGSAELTWYTDTDNKWQDTFYHFMSTYTQPLATYHTLQKSQATTETWVFPSIYFGDIAATPLAITALSGSYELWLGASVDDIDWIYQKLPDNYTLTGGAKYVKYIIKAATEDTTLKIVMPNGLKASISVAATEESGIGTTLASGDYTVTLQNTYFVTKSISLTYTGTASGIVMTYDSVPPDSSGNTFLVRAYDQAGTQVVASFSYVYEGVI